MHRISSKALHVLAASVAMAGLVASARAAISVGPSGAGPLTFDTAPTGGDFLSAYLPGLATDFATVEQVDMLIAGLASTDLLPTFVLATSATMPPSPYAYAFRHNTTGLFLQSRATTVTGTGNPNSAGIILMATLQNDTGADQAGIVLSYDLTVTDPNPAELPGHRVYFSVTGVENSWIAIPEMSGVETTGPLSAQLNLGNWPNGTRMFVVWFDDNANSAVLDPGYAIDNLTIALGTGPKTPVSITQQTNLVDRTVAERQGLVYSITAAGSPIQFQWFHNGTPLENSTNCVNGHDRIVSGAKTSTLRISSVDPNDNGDYHCEVSNSLGSDASDAATLTVTPDTNAPTILYAYPGSNPSEIIVVFSEPLNDSCLGVGGGGAVSDPSNWSIEDIGGSPLGVAGLTNLNDIRGQTTIGLVTSFPHDPSLPFRVEITVPLTDTAVAQNVLTQGTYRLVTPLMALNHMWSFNDQDIDPGPNWFTSDPGIFPPGVGPFDAKRNGGLLHPNGLDDCRANTLYDLGAVGTCLALESQATLTNLIVAYFWTQFDFTGDLNNSDLFFLGKADDGAVVYLNGSELGRIRMPAAPAEITHTTFSAGVVGDGDPRDRILAPRPSQLQSGANLLAISLHQQSPTSSDLTLGYQVFAIEPTSIVRVNVTFSGGNPVISWSPDGGRLEFKNNINDPNWTVLGTSNPFTDTSGQAHRFYRVFFP